VLSTLRIAALSLLLALLAGVLAVYLHDGGRTWGLGAALVLSLSPVPLITTAFFFRTTRRYIHELEQFSTRDSLTGLYNQNAFWDLLQYETQRSQRQQYKFSLLLIDVDNFKVINDTYGHETGDAYLKDIAETFKKAVRKGDIPARYAGDDFAAILPVCDEEQAWVVAKRISDALKNHSFPLPKGGQIQETVSTGVAVYPNHAGDAHDLFLVADSMLARAKASGKDSISFPSDQDNVEMIKNLGEKNIMVLEALQGKGKQIVPHFQPIVSVRDGSVAAYEVLTRVALQDSVIPAAEFIEAAENMGAIGKIDYMLIERAFIKVRERNYPGMLFLNLSPKALVIRDFIPTVRALFRDYRIDPGKMVFEITERDTVKNVRLIEHFVRILRDEGFRFAIDDFGAGYSSFHYLKTFPVDFLKVDGEFIRNMHGSGTIEKEIVTSIASLAGRLGIKTVAEHVETSDILEEVKSAGIDFAQGYFIRRPSPDLG
jgi:diguanylate cyclase (GGDEF)-like protein